MKRIGFGIYAKSELTSADLIFLGKTSIHLYEEKTAIGKMAYGKRIVQRMIEGRKARFLDVILYSKKLMQFFGLMPTEGEDIKFEKEATEEKIESLYTLCDLIAVKKKLTTKDVLESFSPNKAIIHLKNIYMDEVNRMVEGLLRQHNPQALSEHIESLKLYISEMETDQKQLPEPKQPDAVKLLPEKDAKRPMVLRLVPNNQAGIF